ncbi:cytoskeletal adaptor protein [Ophiostoma piceae UAMH 11346]|uniref:Cytoskeletal adaptor protein n=1 Tax=Ophiostoma piceae (strain UAMH 11346) TaxID=1262450 RepID=S3BSX4_OPHP1|nr:cytoskeletal adaptor protein [Ophiostoma piceae UAMH 11346]
MGDCDQSSLPLWQSTDDGSPDDWATQWNTNDAIDTTQLDQTELLVTGLDSSFQDAVDTLASQEMIDPTPTVLGRQIFKEQHTYPTIQAGAITDSGPNYAGRGVSKSSGVEKKFPATEPASDQTLSQTPQPSYRRPVYPSPAHSRAPSPPPSWTELSNTVKLLLVRELTTWYTYRKATTMLQLTNGEELAFRRLYNTEMQKKHRHDAELYAYTERVAAGYEASHGCARPAYSTSANLDQRGSQSPAQHQSEQSVPTRTQQTAKHFLSGLKMDERVTKPNYETDYICMQDFDEAWRYLDWVGFDVRSVDLAHWTGHIGVDRFKIEIPGAAHVFTIGISHHLCGLCESGHRKRTQPIFQKWSNMFDSSL